VPRQLVPLCLEQGTCPASLGVWPSMGRPCTDPAVLGHPQEEVFAVSPSTPLLSTAIDENGWVCGGFPPSTDLSCAIASHASQSLLLSVDLHAECMLYKIWEAAAASSGVRPPGKNQHQASKWKG
jgi:hypothetical protein